MAGEVKRRAVFVITEREVAGGERKTFWTRIGAAFDNRDGSVTLMLEAFPVSGKMQIRDDDRDAKRGAGGGAPAGKDDIPF